MKQEEIDNILETVFLKCDFNDECDECGNPNHEQSWVKMSGWPEEADYYLCQSCALKRFDKNHTYLL